MPRDNAADPIELSDSETDSRTCRNPQAKRGVGRTIPYRIHSRYDGFLTAPATSECRDRDSSRSATLSDESEIEETVPAPRVSTRARMIPTIEIEDDDLDAFRELSQRELRDIERLRIRRHTSSEFESLKSTRGGLEDILVKPGMCVQLIPNSSNRIYFLYIKKIIKARSGQVYLRGILLKRLSDIYYGLSELTGEGLHSVFKPELNELCMHLTYTPGKLVSSGNEECWSEVPLSDVYCERKITFTNYKHPEFNYQNQGYNTMSTHIEGRDAVKSEGSLTCRWKYAEVIRNGRAMPTQFLHLKKYECDEGKGLEDPQRLKGYGKRAKGAPGPEAKTKLKLRSSFVDLTIEVSIPADGSKKRRSDDERVVEETQSKPHVHSSGFKRRLFDGNRDRIVPDSLSQLPRPKRSISTTAREVHSQYTFGDVCTGCGGTFRAAEMAGLIPDWAVDNWHAAIETLFANWPEKRIMPESIDEFLDRVKHDESFRVDVIHISFPCQPHSHMNRGQNEEQDIKNAATITALEHLLKHLRPRIVTLEQTDGILTKNEGLWFRKMVAQLTGESYNVLCERFNMAHYGVPSFRKRLIVVASCPGQELPDWPSPTYGPGLNDFVTTGDVMQDMPENDELHDIKKQQLAFEKKPSRYPMLDTDAPLQRIILTGGAKVHLRGPDGRLYRPTMRQHMRWSTFPDYHLLSNTSITDQRKQIGNAVPPKFMEQIFKQVIKALEKSDRIKSEWREASKREAARQTMGYDISGEFD